jgi:hypothetical protein
MRKMTLTRKITLQDNLQDKLTRAFATPAAALAGIKARE